MIVYSSDIVRKRSPIPPTIPDIIRVEEIKILGVTFNDRLTVHTHIDNVTQTASQALYAIKTLKSHGLDQTSIFSICHATVMSRLLYAVPSWWGFTNSSDRDKLQAVLNRAIRWGFYKRSDPCVVSACSSRERDLFLAVLNNTSHVLHHLLPPVKSHKHDLRSRAHNRILPPKTHPFLEKNFLIRMLYNPPV